MCQSVRVYESGERAVVQHAANGGAWRGGMVGVLLWDSMSCGWVSGKAGGKVRTYVDPTAEGLGTIDLVLREYPYGGPEPVTGCGQWVPSRLTIQCKCISSAIVRRTGLLLFIASCIVHTKAELCAWQTCTL